MTSTATPNPRKRPRTNRLILLALWLLFYCSFTLFSPPLLDDADSVHAEVAREMLTRHDFITLYANNIRYLEKAPLYYWSMAASMRLFGIDTAASRLPLALFVLALALLLEAFARRAFASHRAGLYAGLITLSSFGIFIFSRINIPDILVCFFLIAALYCYYLTERNEAPRSQLTLCLAFAASLALNVLTKGLIGIVFPIAIVLLHLLLTRGLRGALQRLRQLHPLASLGTFLVIAVPWHILIALANPGHGHPGSLSHASGHWQLPYPTDGNVHGWLWFYFLNEQLYRYLNLRIPHDYDTSPLWLFLGLIFIWLMPWSAFLPNAIARAIRSLFPQNPRHSERSGSRSLRATESKNPDAANPHLNRSTISNQGPRSLFPTLRTLAPQASLNLLLLLWLTIPLAFFSLSTRQEYYVLPSLPPMILLISALLAHRAKGRENYLHHHSLFGSELVMTILGIASAIFCVFLIVHAKTPPPGTDLSDLLQQNPANYALSFGHFLDLNAQAMGMFRIPLALAAVTFGVLLPIAAGVRATARYLPGEDIRTHIAALILAAASFLFLIAAWQGLRTFSPTLTSYQLAQAIAPQLQPQNLIAIHGEYEAGSTLAFYLKRNNIHIIEGRSSNLWYGSFFPDAPPIFDTPTEIAHLWEGPQRIFLWQSLNDPDRPPFPLPGPVYVIASSGGKQILSNQPNH